MNTGTRAASHLSVSLTAGATVFVICHRYADRRPILAIHDGSVNLSITATEAPDATQLAFARALAVASAAFLHECEKHAPVSDDAA